jgi:spore maturation protein CgeB
MAETGFSPATRVFEAAGAGACLVTDAWEGIETFLAPGREVLVARDGEDVGRSCAPHARAGRAAVGEPRRARVLAATYLCRRAETATRLRPRCAPKGGRMTVDRSTS